MKTFSFRFFHIYWKRTKNVPWYILAPAAVACDIYIVRRSAHPRGAFLLYRKAISRKKKESHTIKPYCV